MYRYSSRSNQAAFRSNTPLSNEQIMQFAPSVIAEQAHDSRGPRYTFIPTIRVLDGLRNAGFQPFEVRQTRCRDEGKREFTKHMVRLRHPDAITVNSMNQEVPEIVLINSHDGTSSYQLLAGFFRMVCSNGLIAGDICNDIRIRHSGNVVDDVIEGSFRVLDNIKEIEHRVDTYKSVTLAQPEKLLLAEAAQEIRWDDKEKSPIDAEKLLTPKRWADNKDDLWTTFNVVQENLLKGGVRGRTATGKRTSTRAVTGVNENVRLNRALWMLTDRMAALKTGQPIPELVH